MTSQREALPSHLSRQCAPHHTFAALPGECVTCTLWLSATAGMPLAIQPPVIESPIISHCFFPGSGAVYFGVPHVTCVHWHRVFPVVPGSVQGPAPAVDALGETDDGQFSACSVAPQHRHPVPPNGQSLSVAQGVAVARAAQHRAATVAVLHHMALGGPEPGTVRAVVPQRPVDPQALAWLLAGSRSDGASRPVTLAAPRPSQPRQPGNWALLLCRLTTKPLEGGRRRPTSPARARNPVEPTAGRAARVSSAHWTSRYLAHHHRVSVEQYCACQRPRQRL
jgi:hypothetical protein